MRSLVGVITGLFLVIVQAYMSEAQAQPIYRVCASGTVTRTAERENTASRCRATLFGRLAAACIRNSPRVATYQRSLTAIYIIYFTLFRNLYP